MTELAYVNGTFGPVSEATVSINDRGFQFGDGVYEVIVTYDGRPWLMQPHLQRLRRSAAAIHLPYDFDNNPLEPIVEEGLKRAALRDCMVYIQLTRGVAPRNHVAPDDMKPTVIMTFRPRPQVPEDLRRRGASVMTTRDTRWAHCYIKAITLLPNTLAKTEAVRRGYDDAIFVTPEDAVRECTAANLFVGHAGRLLMPPRTEAILHGITQGYLLECAKDVGLPVEEQTFDVNTLKAADEVFMCGTTVDVLAITMIDGHPVGTGQVGPITHQLYEQFHARARTTGR